MKKTYKFNGKLNRNGRNYNVVAVVDIELTNDNVFTASGHLTWGGKWFGMGGQCLNELAEFIKDETFITIHSMWKKHHLNDMHPGTEAQEKALTANGYTAWANDYEKCCKFLESQNLLIDNGYKFGSGWLKREIPNEDLEIIRGLLA